MKVTSNQKDHGTVLELQGKYMGTMRGLPAAQRVKVKKIRAEKGIRAAMAAAKDLGLVNKTQNGWNFWGLTKAPCRPNDPLVALDRAWERYHGRATSIIEGVTDENRDKVRVAIEKQAKEIGSIVASVA